MLQLMQALGHVFQNPKLLELALTHPSTRVMQGDKEDNQRLEFLGDAVIQLLASQYLYEKFPDYDEGKLTSMRTKMVCRDALVAMAKQLELGKYLILTYGMEKMGGRENPHNLEDALEAVFASIYLDAGLAVAAKSFTKCLAKQKSSQDLGFSNSKGALQEFLQAQKKSLPEYRLLEKNGPAHESNFTVALFIDGECISQATEKSIKSAEQRAAHMALQILQGKGV